MVAIRDWVKCIKSNAKRNVPTKLMRGFLNICFKSSYKIGNIKIPKTTPATLHPNGFIPNIAIPTDMISFPKTG